MLFAFDLKLGEGIRYCELPFAIRFDWIEYCVGGVYTFYISSFICYEYYTIMSVTTEGSKGKKAK